MTPRRVTLDQLAMMVANGFESLQGEMPEGFQRLSSRLDTVEATLYAHDGTLQAASRTLDSHSRVLDSHSVALETHSRILESHSRSLERIERKLDSVIELVGDHNTRLRRLEESNPRS